MGSNLVTLVRNLQQRKGRRLRGLALAEGVRLIEEALAAGVTLKGVLVAPALSRTVRGSALLEDLMAHAIPVEELTNSILADLADTESPQGIVAVVEPPRFEVAAIVPRKGFPVMVLDGVQDPGNVGAILRTAFALGSPGAFLLKGTADVANPKVMRAGMGATLRLPTAKLDVGTLARWAEENDVTVWAAGSGGTPVRRLKPPERLALVVGSEGAGISPAVSAVSHKEVTIPLARGAESLNVAVATGILLTEVQRAI